MYKYLRLWILVIVHLVIILLFEYNLTVIIILGHVQAAFIERWSSFTVTAAIVVFIVFVVI